MTPSRLCAAAPPAPPTIASLLVLAAATSSGAVSVSVDAFLIPRSTTTMRSAGRLARPSDPPSLLASSAVAAVPRPHHRHPTALAASDRSALDRAVATAASDPARSLTFSVLVTLCGALLGPFLDSYHSAFGVLQYDDPIFVQLWGTPTSPALITSWWVPPLFGLAGFIIGWLCVLLDAALQTSEGERSPTGPNILAGISLFTFQYYLSGVLFSSGLGRTSILLIMSAFSFLGFALFDGTLAGLWTSVATAVGGPLIEVGLISTLTVGGYHYSDGGETGFFPLWIVPVYFLGGPAVGNLARGFWNALSDTPAAAASDGQTSELGPGCEVCNDTRAVPCPNCDAQGYYVTYGRSVKCNACKGRGLVICRSCFDWYGDDPADIEKVREIMSGMPD